MKWLALVLISCFLSFSSVYATEADDIFLQAVESYKTGDFYEAITLNETVLKMGQESPVLYYNLGNAYFKNKNLGQAVLNYLRAYQILPRDSDIKANLSFARNMVQGEAFSVSGGWSYQLLLRLFSLDELKWIVFGLFVVLSLGVILILFLGLPRKVLFQYIVILGCLLAYGGGGLILKGNVERGLAVVLEPTEGKYEPSAQATTYFRLVEGEEVRVLRLQNDWVKVKRADKKVAWIPNDVLEKVSFEGQDTL